MVGRICGTGAFQTYSILSVVFIAAEVDTDETVRLIPSQFTLLL